ncbi:MAG: GAF domain-containing protein [Candidatus Methylomirabilales bacterium]
MDQKDTTVKRPPDVSRDRGGRPDTACILVVVDDPKILRMLQEVLERDGYAVLPTSSGETAVELIKTRPISLVVLDSMIPEGGGIAVCRHIKADPSLQHTPVILLTGKPGDRGQALSREIQADDALAKPVRAEELLAKVQAHLRIRRVAHEALARNRELTFLNALGEAVGQSLNQEEVLRAALEKIGELEEVQSAYILLREPEGEGVKLAGDDATACREGAPAAVEAEVLREGLPRCYPDVSDAPDLHPIPIPPGAGSFLLIPLSGRGWVAGVLGVFSRLPARFDEVAVRSFTAVGRRLTGALTNAALYSSLVQQLSQVQALSQLRASIVTSPMRDRIMGDIVRRFVEGMHVDRCAITLAAPGEASAHLIVGYDRFKENPWVEGINLSLDRYPEIRRVLETQKPLVVPDVAEEPVLSGIRDLLLSLPIRSMVVVPLFRQDHTVGVVTVSSRGPVRAFTRGEVEFCQTLANQAALTLEKSALFEEVQDRANRLQTLIHLTKLMTASLNLQEVFDFAVKAAAEFLEVPCVRLWVADEETREMLIRASYGLQEFAGVMVDRIPYGRGVIGRIREEGEPHYVADVRQEPHFLNKRFLKRAGIVSFAGIPLISEGRVLGVLSIFTRERRLFSPDERALMAAFASHAAIAIGNARAYQQIQRYASTVAELYEAATQVSGSLDMDETLQKIARGAAASTDAASSTIILLDELREVTHMVDWEVGEIEVRKDGISRQVWETGRPVVLPDFARVPSGTINPRLLALGRRAAVCLPLQVRDRVRGVMWVHYNEPRRVVEEDLHLLASFANQAAIAIENARLFAETRRLANTDALTGLFNHRYFYHLLDTEVKRARRYGRSLSLIMLDIDHFKEFNDRHGHLAGDEALRCLAQILRKNSRRVDTVARYGGEEFAIILPETDLEQAAVQAERLRVAAAEQQWPEGALTISLGAAALAPDMARVEDLVRDADRALYQAKAAGRNQVCLS